MADDIMDAHEQSERARVWLQQNGSSIVVGVLLGLAVLLGWQRWQQSSVSHRAEALVKFEQLEQAASKDDVELAGKLVEDLQKNYGDTAHASLAALEQAELLLKTGKLPEAESALRFAAENAVQESLRAVASVRLARVLIARGEPQKAIDALAGVKAEGFKSDSESVRGDALLALGKSAEAIKAYDIALAETDVAAPQRRSIEIKRDDLVAGAAPGAPPVPAAAPAAPAAPVVEAKPAEQG